MTEKKLPASGGQTACADQKPAMSAERGSAAGPGQNPAAEYDLIVIGGGPAGYTAALEAAGKGMRTALVERRELGGTCLNRGCIPTKTLLHSAELFAQMRSCGSFGIHAEQVRCDMEEIQARKEEVTAQLRGGIEMLMKKNKVTVYQGSAQIVGAHEVRLCGDGRSQAGEPNRDDRSQAGEPHRDDRNQTSEPCGNDRSQNKGSCAADRTAGAAEDCILRARYILIATGSVPAFPPIPGIDFEDVVTSDELLSKKTLYPRLTIIGGGVIGMEFASIYSALGCKVTVIEFLDRILANMDREISQNLKMILKKRGVEIHTGAQVQEISRGEDGGLICRYVEKGAEYTAASDGVLAAVGRKANTEGLFGSGLEIETDRGRVPVDEYGRTSVPGIYAAGDVTPGIQLAHAASAQGINAVAHMLCAREGVTGAFVPPIRADIIPGCVYTDPEIGCVGLTQDEAKTHGIAVTVKKYPMSANGKTVLSSQERGFLKVVADADSHVILGAQMMCARATDMISEFGTAIVNGLTLEQMAAVVRPHPTFSEAISEVVRS